MRSVRIVGWQLGPYADRARLTPPRSPPGRPAARAPAVQPRMAGTRLDAGPLGFPRSRSPGDLGVFTPDALDALGDGDHELRLGLQIWVEDLEATSRWFVPSDIVPVEAGATVTLQPPEFASLKSDPAVAPAVRSSLRVLRCGHGPAHPTATDWDNPLFHVAMEVDGPPVPLAFRLYIRRDDQSWELGALACEAGARRKLTVANDEVPGVFTGRCDVVLRPSAAVAREAGFAEAWGAEVVFPDVPIQRPATRPSE
jgi:hypothetical protein